MTESLSLLKVGLSLDNTLVYSFLLPLPPVSNKGNPAARAYVGMSAAYECMDYEAEYEGYGRSSYVKSFYTFHEFQVVGSGNQAIRALFTFSLRSLFTRKTLFSYTSCTQLKSRLTSPNNTAPSF